MKAADFLKSYWRICLSLATATGFLIYSFIGKQPATVDAFGKLLVFSLTAILALQVAESIDIKAQFKKAGDEARDSLREVLRELDQNSTYLVGFNRAADYADLFDDLQQEFLSYNPHQFAHQSVAIEEDEIIEIMRRRYQSRDFKMAQFLICTGDNYGKENFGRFCRRLHTIYRRSGAKREIKRKVHIRVSTTKSFVSEPTYHLQHKRGMRSVIELRLSSLTVRNTPMPRFYLVSISQPLREALRSYFETEWAAAKQVNLEELLEAMDTGSGEDAIRRLLV